MKIILVILTTILTSFYFFPFEFVLLPGINTKMAMAGVGLVCFVFNLAKGRKGDVDRAFIVLSLISFSLSIFSLVSMIYNNTPDDSFLTYFVSMYVWLGGSYTAINVIKKVHSYISIELVCKYLILVCVLQCVLAYSMTIMPGLKNFVDGFLGGNDAFMGKAGDRLYGIGAALDVAGLRFSAVLVMISYMVIKHNDQRSSTMLYLLAFIIITIIGNMMARTTTVGVIIALVYWIVSTINNKKNQRVEDLWKCLAGILVIVVPIIVFYYNTDHLFRNNIRFAFEGFFSLAETGRWSTSSNDILLNHMIVFPETIKTWLIGDGYGANPSWDPYYVGPNYHGFYKGTDIGYLRFLFYFGVFGTLALISLICYAAHVCIKRFPSYRMMFLFILAVNLIVWFKVSTDIFMVFALFLCVTEERCNIESEQNENSIPDSLNV